MSNAFDKASLVMLPHAYEEGKLYSLKPTDRSGDFTFSRGTDTATRVGEDGYIKKEYANLLLQSNTFSDAAWSSSNFTLTPNQSGYDGSNDAWKAQVSTTYNSLSQTFGGSGVYTFSGYFRKGDSNEGIRFNFSASTDTNVYVDLTDGSSTFNGALIERSITDAGNGFYKVVVTANLTNPNSVRIFVTNGGTTMIAGSIYIQDAMLNQGLVAYPYLETTTAPVYGGLTDDMPRLDYSGGATCPSLLLEPSRTNLIEQSEYFEDSKIGTVTLTTNSVTSPEGLQNASTVICPGGRLAGFASLTSGTDYVVSVFAKQKGDTFNIRAADGTNPNVEFNLATQTTTDTNGAVGSIEDYGNGWYRCIMKFTASATGSFEIRYVLITDANGLYAYGAQFEQGSYPTSYIPTYGSSQTRARDESYASVVNTESRTYFLSGKRLASESTANTSPIYQPNDNLSITFWTINRFRFRFGGTINKYYILTGNDFKIALSYNGIDTDIYINGQYWETQSSFNLGNLSALSINGNESISYNQLLLFPTALSDSECIALTTV